jgi:hypothetical protein
MQFADPAQALRFFLAASAFGDSNTCQADCGEGKSMTLMQWLNKLGILRWGGKAAVYHNALERPIELQQAGVFNAERDLMFGGEKKPAKPACCDKPQPAPGNK